MHNIKHSADIFTTKWTESERNAIGVYAVEIDETNKKDTEYYINTGITYAFSGGKVTGSYGTATAKSLDDVLFTQADQDAGRGTKGALNYRGLKYLHKEAIENDFNTVAGLVFYDHKETPGLGAEVDNPKWKALWAGKKIYDENGVKLQVIKGIVSKDDAEIEYKVDGLSGATLTARGVSNMISYWFGESGYSKLLEQLNYES